MLEGFRCKKYNDFYFYFFLKTSSFTGKREEREEIDFGE